MSRFKKFLEQLRPVPSILEEMPPEPKKPATYLYDPAKYPMLCRHYLSAYIYGWLEGEQKLIEFLSGLNLPIPERLDKEHTSKYSKEWYEGCGESGCKEHPAKWRHTLVITNPSFGPLPSYFTFEVNAKGIYQCLGFLLGDEILLSKAKELHSQHDFISLIRDFPIRWFNKDPYEFYKEKYNQNHVASEDEWTEKKKLYYYVPRTPDSFEEYQQPFDLEQLLTAQERLKVFRRYVSGLHQAPTVEDYHLKGWWSGKMDTKGIPEHIPSALPLPDLTIDPDAVSLKILPSREAKPQVIVQFFESLQKYLSAPISFELVGSQGRIYFQITVSKKDQAQLERELQLFFPDFSIVPAPPLAVAQDVYFLRARPSYLHEFIKTTSDFSIDPFAQLFAVLSNAAPADCTIYQVLLAPLPLSIHTPLFEYVKDYRRKHDFEGEALKKINDRIRNFEQKYPPWIVELCIQSTRRDVIEKLRVGFLGQYQTALQDWQEEISAHTGITRELTKDFGIVSTQELASLAHFPDKTVNCDDLETASMKAKHPPPLYTGGGIHIGTCEARGQVKEVHIPDSVRDRHTYVVGKSGTGKSTLLYNCICQDIADGSGVAVIDPHGDLVEDVLKSIPESRIEDTIYFNAGDKEHPISLNIMNAESEDEIGLLADDLLITFKRISETWGERMDTILRYAFHTMLRVSDTTLLDLATLFQNPNYREQVLDQIDNKLLLDFWQNQYANNSYYAKDAAQPILSRLAKFALSPTLSGILGQPSSNLNFFDVIQNKKILLVNLSKGVIGEDSAQLLGSLIVSQLQLSIMRRAALPKESRDPYYLYVDEFQNFTTSAFERILSEARKYKLCLTLAHQYISQLDEKIKNAILANVGTIIIFQSYPADAQTLRPELGQYEPTDVTNLDTAAHEALCKPSTQSKDTFLFQTLAPPPRPESFAREIIEYTRENYAGLPTSYAVEPRVSVRISTKSETVQASRPKLKRPARALLKDFASASDKILHYIKEAEWLATPHLIELCYGHLETEGSKKSGASRDLKHLVEAKRIRTTMFGPNKIYFSGRTPNTTKHNYSVRDLYTKIVASDFEIAEMNFFPPYPVSRQIWPCHFWLRTQALSKHFGSTMPEPKVLPNC